MGASETLQRPRKFWLVADAELIVYGATEPDATVLDTSLRYSPCLSIGLSTFDVSSNTHEDSFFGEDTTTDSSPTCWKQLKERTEDR